jgi:hypothetical protein
MNSQKTVVSVFILHQLLHFVYIISNMFRLSYTVIISESFADNKQPAARHRMVTIHMLQCEFLYILRAAYCLQLAPS